MDQGLTRNPFVESVIIASTSEKAAKSLRRFAVAGLSSVSTDSDLLTGFSKPGEEILAQKASGFGSSRWRRECEGSDVSTVIRRGRFHSVSTDVPFGVCLQTSKSAKVGFARQVATHSPVADFFVC